MSDITLTFLNESNDINNSSIVIFQKNEHENQNELGESNFITAWKVFPAPGPEMIHTIQFPSQIEISIQDEWRNMSPRQKCLPGDSFNIATGKQGVELTRSNRTSSLGNDIVITSNDANAYYNCNLYRNGKLLMGASRLTKGDEAKFNILPKLYIGVASQIAEGESINSAIIASIETEFNLEGIKTADIVMIGGGEGKESKPYTFNLVITEVEYK